MKQNQGQGMLWKQGCLTICVANLRMASYPLIKATGWELLVDAP